MHSWGRSVGLNTFAMNYTRHPGDVWNPGVGGKGDSAAEIMDQVNRLCDMHVVVCFCLLSMCVHACMRVPVCTSVCVCVNMCVAGWRLKAYQSTWAFLASISAALHRHEP